MVSCIFCDGGLTKLKVYDASAWLGMLASYSVSALSSKNAENVWGAKSQVNHNSKISLSPDTESCCSFHKHMFIVNVKWNKKALIGKWFIVIK